MEGWSLDRGGKPRGRKVDFRGGTQYPEVGHAALVLEEERERREPGLNGQYVGGSTHEAISCPSLDLVPESGELPSRVEGGQEGVRAVAEDGEEKGRGQSVAEERREADPWWGETLDRHEGGLGLGQPFDAMGGSGD